MSTPEPPPYPSGDDSSNEGPSEVGAEPTNSSPGYPPPPPAYGAPSSPYGQPQPPGLVPPNNRFAVPSLILGILSIVGVCCYGGGGVLLGIPAAILGHLGKREIRDSAGAQSGHGMAQAGFITGIVGSVLGVLGFIVVVLLVILGFAVDPGSFE